MGAMTVLGRKAASSATGGPTARDRPPTDPQKHRRTHIHIAKDASPPPQTHKHTVPTHLALLEVGVDALHPVEVLFQAEGYEIVSACWTASGNANKPAPLTAAIGARTSDVNSAVFMR